MRLQGQLFNWNDEKGFGFVEPNGGGERAFVHVNAFSSRKKRPINGDVIIYELTYDNNGKYKAENIKFANTSIKLTQPKNIQNRTNITNVSEFFIIVFCISLFGAVLVGSLPPIILWVYLVSSLFTFIVYAIDKSAAQRGHWRTQESFLHLLSLIGGWPGAYFAQQKLRHKSSKAKFKRVFWVCTLVNVAALIWLQAEQGFDIFNNIIVKFFNG